MQGRMRDWEVIQKHNHSLQRYHIHLMFFLKHKNTCYIEERKYPYQFYEADGKIMEHRKIKDPAIAQTNFNKEFVEPQSIKRSTDTFDRRKTVQYAENWWDTYNPAFRNFDVDCTNYVSQCLLAGGGSMHGSPQREDGWWYGDNSWSFSWAVAHSMRWYLSGATTGIAGVTVESAEELHVGDVICYDFEGDGRWDHTTIVVAKDDDDMPLVNAHTDNSRHRYWNYEDSAAWTPQTAYKFFNIHLQ